MRCVVPPVSSRPAVAQVVSSRGTYDDPMTARAVPRTARAERIALRCGALLAGVLVASLAACSATPDVARTTSAFSSTAGSATPSHAPATPSMAAKDVAAIRRLLAARVHSLSVADERGWVDSAVPTPPARRAAVAEYRGLRTLGAESLTYSGLRLRTARGSGRSATAATVRVSGTYAVRGADGVRAFSYDQGATRTPAGWRLAEPPSLSKDPMPPWRLPGLRVVRSGYGVVAGNVPAGRLRDYQRILAHAVPQVERYWGTSWKRHVLVVVPATPAQFAALVYPPGGAGADVAAVTQGLVSAGSTAPGDTVVLDPTAFASLTDTGRSAVLTHEIAHVAARSSTRYAVPTWLSEGTAEDIGYAGDGVSRQVLAAGLLAEIRAGYRPADLPSGAAFAVGKPGSKGTGVQAYALAYLVCAVIADHWGRAALVRFYRASARATTRATTSMAAGADRRVDAAFASVLHTTRSPFVARWTAYLLTLAGKG